MWTNDLIDACSLKLYFEHVIYVKEAAVIYLAE